MATGLRAAILVTGTEVLTGIISDRNGPWLSEQLRAIGADVVQITVVGDRPEDLASALAAMREAGVGLVVTSGGLGPTADDLTAQVIADFQNRPMRLDVDLEQRIADILAPLTDRWPDLDLAAVREANRKQALVPQGATVLDPVGTAPGLVVPPPDGEAGPTVVVLPGPPRELRPMWEDAIACDAFKLATRDAKVREQAMLRLFGMPESQLAATIREMETDGLDLSPLEITTCLRRGEIEIATSFDAADRPAYERFEAEIEAAHGDLIFSRDATTIDQLLAELLAGTTIALAESCTAGLVTARLADQPGASSYLLGGLAAYSNDAKSGLLGVEDDLIARHGAVSEEVCVALADGARGRFGAEIGVGLTGIAGPGGGTDEKPVGLVWFAVTRDGQDPMTLSVQLPGGRSDVRERSTTVALHVIRRALEDRQKPA